MRKIISLFLIVSLVGCATTQGNIPRGTEADNKYDCSRFEAAWNLYVQKLNPVTATKIVYEDCITKNPGACIVLPLTPVFFTAFFVLGMIPLVPLIMISPDVKERGCPVKVAEDSMDAAISDEQK
jgi:hypothetical protein